MRKLSRDDLFPLENYAVMRGDFRHRVMAHKKPRQLHLGPHVTLYFEDRLTIQYQIQEMLRVERIFEADGITEELDAYNPLIPDGCNLKATMMIEYEDRVERTRQLRQLVGIEDQVWLRVAGMDKVMAIADEDLERSTEDKTSAVHFLRFEFAPEMIAAMKAGAAVSAGIDHDACKQLIETIPAGMHAALVKDFD